MVSTNAWTVILVLVGAVLLLAGVAGGYLASVSNPEFFSVWMVLAFIGVLIVLAGIAMGMGGKSEKKE